MSGPIERAIWTLCRESPAKPFATSSEFFFKNKISPSNPLIKLGITYAAMTSTSDYFAPSDLRSIMPSKAAAPSAWSTAANGPVSVSVSWRRRRLFELARLQHVSRIFLFIRDLLFFITFTSIRGRNKLKSIQQCHSVWVRVVDDDLLGPFDVDVAAGKVVIVPAGRRIRSRQPGDLSFKLPSANVFFLACLALYSLLFSSSACRFFNQ